LFDYDGYGVGGMNNLQGIYGSVVNYRPDDTCPECNTENDNQILKGDKIILYICHKCQYRWMPIVKVNYQSISYVRQSDT
jgi:hypothetical protein